MFVFFATPTRPHCNYTDLFIRYRYKPYILHTYTDLSIIIIIASLLSFHVCVYIDHNF